MGLSGGTREGFRRCSERGLQGTKKGLEEGRKESEGEKMVARVERANRLDLESWRKGFEGWRNWGKEGKWRKRV